MFKDIILTDICKLKERIVYLYDTMMPIDEYDQFRGKVQDFNRVITIYDLHNEYGRINLYQQKV